MKKILLSATTLAVMLGMTSCTYPAKAEDTVKVTDYINMVEVCSDITEQVFYDRNTGVMYYQYCWSRSNCGITPIYNADGSLKIFEGWVDKK